MYFPVLDEVYIKYCNCKRLQRSFQVVTEHFMIFFYNIKGNSSSYYRIWITRNCTPRLPASVCTELYNIVQPERQWKLCIDLELHLKHSQVQILIKAWKPLLKLYEPGIESVLSYVQMFSFLILFSVFSNATSFCAHYISLINSTFILGFKFQLYYFRHIWLAYPAIL